METNTEFHRINRRILFFDLRLRRMRWKRKLYKAIRIEIERLMEFYLNLKALS